MTIWRRDVAQGVKIKRGSQVVPIAFLVKVSQCCVDSIFSFEKTILEKTH